MQISQKTIFSISYFMMRRNDLISCLTNDKPYLEKKEAVLEALKSFHILLTKFPDDELVTQKEYDKYFQLASESLSDIGASELAPNNIDNTINLILDRTKNLIEVISRNFPEIIKENRKEMQLLMTSVGNMVRSKSDIKRKKYNYNIIHFSERGNMRNKTLKYFSNKNKGKLKKSIVLFHDAEAPLKSKLRADIQDELEAIREYDEHIDTISDENIKGVLTHIRDEEKQHVGELSALVDRVDPLNIDLFEKGYEEATEMMTKEEYFSLLSDFLSKPKQIEIGSMPFDLNKKGVYEGHYKGMEVIIDRYKKDKEDAYKAIIYGIDTYKNAAIKKVNETKKIDDIRDKDKKYLEGIVPVELYISQIKDDTYINIILKSIDAKFSYSVLFKNNPFNIENIQILNKN